MYRINSIACSALIAKVIVIAKLYFQNGEKKVKI
jgi:hypothetical protein